MNVKEPGGLAPSHDEAYAAVSVAMEAAFVRARADNPELGADDLLVSLLLLKDRLLEHHIDAGALAPRFVALARELYEI
jgi:hypothetical protein